MKKLILLIVFLLTIHISYAQVWLNNLPKNKSTKELSFYDYQKAFYDYWKPFNVKRGYYYVNGKKIKAAGWKQFKRWEWDMEGQIDKQTGKLPAQNAQFIYEQYKKSHKQLKNTSAANWVLLGTNSSDGGYAGIGRINCIAFHPTDANTYWVGAPAGGLWKTTDNGNTWVSLTDNNAVLGISDIVIPSDYATSNTIYIATGDKDGWDNKSVGVLKSTDGGTTWNSTGLSFTLADNQMVNRLLMDPGDNTKLIAATTAGVYRSVDAGANWTKISSFNFIDMESKSGNFSTLYGSTKSGTIYVSTNEGLNWTQTLNEVNAERIELAVSAANDTIVYAVAANSDAGLFGVYKSSDSGTNFTKVLGDTLNILGYEANGSSTGGQGWYDLTLASSPDNANVILVGGINTWRSTDGGIHWDIVNHWWGDGVQAVHADKHMLKYRNNGDLFETNDGGVYLSNNDGSSWTDKTNGMVISQMYKLGVSQTEANAVITGLQDNGSKLLHTDNNWYDVKGGDGMECIIDYADYNIQYATYTNGQIDRTTNAWNSKIDISQNIGDGTLEGAWVTPYIIDPDDHNTLYVGYADVWKTTDKGNSFEKISNINSYNYIRSMAIAPSNNKVLYVADYYDIWKTIDGGVSWSTITGTLPVSDASIKNIAVKFDDPNTLWVVFSGYNQYKVYESSDAGANWSDISTGLPELPVYTIVQNKQSDSEVHLYVGTELGVYFKKGNNDWIAFNTGLPNVKIGELEIYYDNNDFSKSKLRAATYGRGLWETFLEAGSSNGLIFEKAATNTEGNLVEIKFNLAMKNPTGTHSDFVVNNGTDIQPDSAYLKDGDTQIIVLRLPSNISAGETVSVSYTKGSVESDNNILLSDFTNKPVNNLVGTATGILTKQNTEKFASDMTIYPNPNSGSFTIRFGNKVFGNIKVTIYNIQGKIIFSRQLSNISKNYALPIQMDNAKKGVYKLLIENGNERFQQSILIQ
jgi:hypothetical protein